jgi:hypothetical protein
VKRSERIYRWLLGLYPRDFRDEYGQEMSLLFRARADEGSLRLWLQVLGDLVFHAPHEHWSTMRQELRCAIRQLRRSPGFSAVVIATLAVGIGGTTAVFSVLQAVLLDPLPYEQPGQLVRLYQQEPDKPDTQHYLTGTHFSFLRDNAASFEAATALGNYRERGLDLVRGGSAQRLRVLRVTSDYFDTLRFGPLRGPGFDRRDEVGTRRVVLSSGVWRSALGAESSIVGSTIRLSGAPYEVVGIAPQGFEDPIAGDVDAWVPYNLAGDTMEDNHSLSAVAWAATQSRGWVPRRRRQRSPV